MGKIFTTAKTLFGLDIKNTLAGDTVQRTHSFTADLLRELGPKRDYRVETFDEAVQRLNLTDERLQRRRWEMMIESRMTYALGFGALLYSMTFAVSGDLLGFVGCISISGIGLTAGFTKAFRVHQIDERELMSFPAFIRDPAGWLK